VRKAVRRGKTGASWIETQGHPRGRSPTASRSRRESRIGAGASSPSNSKVATPVFTGTIALGAETW